MSDKFFPVIDPIATGKNIEGLRKARGLTVTALQEYFNFEAPQAIYKWQKGQSLPSTDNLYALSYLFQVSIEEILVPRQTSFQVLSQEKSCGSHRFGEDETAAYPEQSEMDNSSGDSAETSANVAMTLMSDTQSMEGNAYTGSGERSFIAGYRIQYNEDGLERERYFCSMPSFGYRTCDANGIFGLRYTYDSKGRLVLLQYLDENNEVMNTSEGIAQRVYTYDENKQTSMVEYQDKDGNRVINREGWAVDIEKYQDGNIVAEEWRDEKGELVNHIAGSERLDFR